MEGKDKMKTIDERLIELCSWAEDEASIFRDLLENEGPFLGITKGADGEWWAVFEDDECRIQNIIDLGKMLHREKVIA